jgi:hypothetical protein
MRRRRRTLHAITATIGLTGLAFGSAYAAGPAIARPAAAAVAAHPPYGEIVVSDGNAIKVFAPGANGDVAPIRTISGANTQIGTLYGLDLDPAGNIWVADHGSNQIEEFAANANGNVAPLRTITTPTQQYFSQPEGIAVDPVQHLVWVGSFNSSTLAGFKDTDNGTLEPERKISGPNVGLTFTRDIWMSPNHQQLWATDYNHHAVQEYSPTGVEDQAPLRTIQLDSSDTVFGVAVDRLGVVHVSAGSANSIESFGAASNTTPISTISGPDTGVHGPAYLSFDPAGHMWAAIQGGGAPPVVPSSVEAFAPGAHGDAKPIVRITGPTAHLTNPWDVVVYGAKPSAPRSLKATNTKRTITVSWHSPSSTGGGLLGYVIRRKNSKHGKWVAVAVATKREYVDTHPKRHHRYRYDVIAVNTLGQSPASAQLAAATKPKHHKHKHKKHHH